MIEERMSVGVLATRRAVDHPWQDHAWEPTAVLEDVPDVAAWTLLRTDGRNQIFYIGPAEVELVSSETGNYRDNLATGAPKLWVVVRQEGEQPLTLLTVTADPREGEAHTETGTSIVAAVTMPEPIASWMADFVEQHHVERPFIKRKRDRLKPDEFGRRNRSGESREGHHE